MIKVEWLLYICLLDLWFQQDRIGSQLMYSFRIRTSPSI